MGEAGTHLERLKSLWAEISDIGHAVALLEWDQLVLMPPGGARARGEQIATLRRLGHERLTAEPLGAALAAAEADAGADGEARAWLRVARRERDRAARVPAELVAEMSRAATDGYFAWVRAREHNAYREFAPALARLLELARRYADAVGHGGQRYDALLEQHEPGLDTARLRALFAELRAGLAPLLAAIAQRPPHSRGPMRQAVPEAQQWRAGERAISALGYDWRRGRQDRSVHPFSTSFGPGDCRITTRLDPGDFAVAFFASLHETGHALYEQGLPERWSRGPLGQAASTGVHESQSRFWENRIGRSLAFWQHFLPTLREAVPGCFDEATAESLYSACNVVAPSAVRVEADEVTYNLHVALRFELELDLLSGELPVADLPEAWKQGMAAALGVRPDTDVLGCLQDVHWSEGGFGYFPSYTLGNVLAAQWTQAMDAALGGVDALVRRGEFEPVLAWLHEHIHARGASLTPEELTRAVTGGPIAAGPWLGYVRDKYGALYGL